MEFFIHAPIKFGAKVIKYVGLYFILVVVVVVVEVVVYSSI